MKGLDPVTLQKCRVAFENDRTAKVLMSAAARTDIHELSFVPAEAAKLAGPFSVEVPTMAVTSQEKSGRCWAFAGMNVMREIAAKKMGVDELRLSGNYVAFFDKLEKCATFLDRAVETADLPTNDRAVCMLANGIGDGGYWIMFSDLVEKYGIVPEEVMPETYASTHTENFMEQLNRILRKDAVLLRTMISAGENIDVKKSEMIAEIYRALCIVFGEPPVSFSTSWLDRDKKRHDEKNITPKAFFDAYIGEDLSHYLTVENRPTARMPVGKRYRYPYISCMTGSTVDFLNLPVKELKELAIRQLTDGLPVWFICDVDKGFDRGLGILDPASFCYGEILGGVDLSMEKGDSLEWRETSGNHAMVFTGVELDGDGKPVRWKIENTWGKECGKDGYFVCSDAYFTEYVYEVIVKDSYLDEKQKEILASEPVELALWDLDVK